MLQQYFLSEKQVGLESLKVLTSQWKAGFVAAEWNKKPSVSQTTSSRLLETTASLGADNDVQAAVNSPGLPSMQTAFPHTASLYILQWLHHICKVWDVLGCQGQENRAVRWKINVWDERHTTVLHMAAWRRHFLASNMHLYEIELSFVKTHFLYF